MNIANLPLLNLRLGFATNSSSTHSIICGYSGFGRRSQSPGYGWDEFVLVDQASKQDYLAHLLSTSSPKTWPAIQNATGLPDPHPDGYVDHQSMMPSLDNVQDRQTVVAFVKDMHDWIMRDDIAIKGGNDNSEETVLDREYAHARFSLRHLGISKLRKEADKVWTSFHSGNGMRATFDFNGIHPEDLRDLITSTPMLVDMKITDFCDTGCTYCYQGSTPKGQHASLEDVCSALDVCAEMRVLEVAFGGGEPMKHPHFLTILRECRSRDIVPNFTTRELDWLADPKLTAEIAGVLGAFAFSVDSVADVERLTKARRKALDANPDLHLTAHVQYVVGSRPAATRQAIMHEVNRHWGMPLTLLGWKTTGRGETARRHADPSWLRDVLEMEDLAVGIDTCLAAEAEEALKTAKIPPQMYQTREGCMSMYWDCVTGTMGPSSFAPDRMRPVPSTVDGVQKLYQTFKRASLPVIDT